MRSSDEVECLALAYGGSTLAATPGFFSMQDTQPARVRVGVFELDLKSGELRTGDHTVVLQEQPLQVLRMLVEREGELVTREEIKKKLWPNDTIVEFDHSINAAIKNLRRALGDSADEPKYIGTVARRGYRLMVAVEWVTGEDPLAPSPTLSPEAGEKGGAPAPVGASALAGRTVSHYRVLDIIGGGGMGVVYRAEDLKLGRQVALKFLPEDLGSDPQVLERFSREARAISSLDHPNICPIFEFGEHESRPFIVMQLLEGQTLRDRLAAAAEAGQAIPLVELLDVGIQVSDGLQAAHEKGIIHRDIKPANIFLTTKGAVKILDFGLAKLLVNEQISELSSRATRSSAVADERGVEGPAVPSHLDTADPSTACPPGREDPAGEESGHFARDDNSRGDNGAAEAAPLHPATPVDPSLTRTGAAMGTAGYMSPEQVRGQKLDARTDIFSFGLVLYEMATGRRPFAGATAAIVHDAILHNTPVPVRELNSTLPAKLVTTIDKCLEKEREQRYQRAAEVRRALQQVQSSGENKRTRISRAAVGAAVLIVVALAIGSYLRRVSHTPSLGASSSSLDVRTLTENGKSYRVAATPDGSYVAYVKKEAGKYELRLLQVATERDVQLLPGAPQRINSLHFSRDGNFLYFLRVLDPAKDPHTSGVFRIGTLGGPVTTLATDARPVSDRYSSVTVSPDGKQIAYIAQTASESLIVAIDADGSNRHVLARRPIGQSFWYVEWSPSQDTLAAVADNKDTMVLVRVDLPSGSMRELTDPGWAIGQPAWSSDGATIFAPANPSDGGPIMQIWTFDAHTGAHRALTSSSTRHSEQTLSATANDDLVANSVGTETNLSVTDHSGQRYPLPVLRGEGSDAVVWVDKRIVTGNGSEMVVHDPDGRNPTKLRAYSSSYEQLARCGPGNVVYWAYDAKRHSHIARTDITTGSSSALTDGPNDDQPTCTADGSTLVFDHCSEKGDHCALTRKSLDSGQSRELYQFDPADNNVGGDPSPSVSPDGKSVLFWRYTPAEDSYEWAGIIPLAGGEVRKVRMPVPASQFVGQGAWGAFRWAADGKSIFYARNEKGIGNIWSVPLAGGAPKRLTNFDSEQIIFAFDVSPENRLVISRGNWISDVVLIKRVKE